MKVAVNSQQVLASSVAGRTPSNYTHTWHPTGTQSSVSDTSTPTEQKSITEMDGSTAISTSETELRSP